MDTEATLETTPDLVEGGDETAGEETFVESAEPTLDELIEASLESDDTPPEAEVQTEPETPTYTVKVDGEEVAVTLEELLGGYQRQADYTRKTQALDSERERFAAFEQLDRALQADAEGTLRALARQYGLNDLAGNPAQKDPLEGVPDELVDPLEREVAELRQWKATLEQERLLAEEQARIAAVDAEIESIRSTFQDPSLDEDALLRFAIDHQIGDLTMAYRSMKAVEAEAQAQAERNRIVAEKRTLPPVEGGTARNSAAVRRGGSSRMSLDEALEAALSGE